MRKDDSHLPAQQRLNWGYSSWVIESWNKASKLNGWDKRADIVRQNILQAAKRLSK
jgi:hypothetical protein